jgi:hypothetical protein
MAIIQEILNYTDSLVMLFSKTKKCLIQLVDDETKIGAAGGQTVFEDDGFQRMEDGAEAWEDMLAEVGSLRNGSVAPDPGGFLDAGGLRCLRFDGNNQLETVDGTIQFSHSYKQGSSVYPHVHWAPTDGSPGNVCFHMEYSWANRWATFPASTTNRVVYSCGGTAWNHRYTDFSSISASGKEISSLLKFRIWRDPQDPSDTYTNDITILYFDVHYKKDSIGSRDEDSK